jgi:hypothetical protein
MVDRLPLPGPRPVVDDLLLVDPDAAAADRVTGEPSIPS